MFVHARRLSTVIVDYTLVSNCCVFFRSCLELLSGDARSEWTRLGIAYARIEHLIRGIFYHLSSWIILWFQLYMLEFVRTMHTYRCRYAVSSDFAMGWFYGCYCGNYDESPSNFVDSRRHREALQCCRFYGWLFMAGLEKIWWWWWMDGCWTRIVFGEHSRKQWSIATFQRYVSPPLWEAGRFSYESFRPSTPSRKELAAAIVVLKNRHRMSIKCVDDLCQLMRVLKIPSFPTRFKGISRLLLSDESTPSAPVESIIMCPSCCSISISSSHCDNVECNHHRSYSLPPFTFMTIPILSQLRDILARTSNLNFGHQKQTLTIAGTAMHDIYQGDVYREIARKEKDDFLSLIMNVDGVQVSKSSSSSLWIITFAINELKRNERFKMKNIIVGGILSAPSKPSRDHMRVFLQPCVNELIVLEQGESFEVTTMKPDRLVLMKVFLIGSCCDKPAQSLVQGISEPTGAYGCGRCEIEGTLFVSLSPSFINSIDFHLQELPWLHRRNQRRGSVFFPSFLWTRRSLACVRMKLMMPSCPFVLTIEQQGKWSSGIKCEGRSTSVFYVILLTSMLANAFYPILCTIFTMVSL